MIALPAGTTIWIAFLGITDLRRGFTGPSAPLRRRRWQEQDPLLRPYLHVFRRRRGDLIKLLWWDGDGLCLFAKRLERGRFIWPQAEKGAVSLSRAQLSMLLEGIDWRRPFRTSDAPVGLDRPPYAASGRRYSPGRKSSGAPVSGRTAGPGPFSSVPFSGSKRVKPILCLNVLGYSQGCRGSNVRCLGGQ